MKRIVRNIRIMRQLIKSSQVGRLFVIYFIYFLLASLLIYFFEPKITTFPDSLWYCFAVATTVGFGDLTAVSVGGRIVSVILSFYSVIIIAIFTAIITGYVMDRVKLTASESAAEFLDELERLPELSHEELVELSQKVEKFRKK